jgi:cytochrome c-type biogenesis protein CcmH
MAVTGFKAQWRWLSWVLIAIIGVAALIVGAASDGGPQSDGERMSQLASTIRCPQCRGQSVAESNVAIAREIRGDIRTRISEGETDDEIRQVYIDRYGRSIVLNPDSGGFTGLVWIVPVVAAGLATAAVALAFRRWRVQADSLREATEEDRELVAELRRDRS